MRLPVLALLAAASATAAVAQSPGFQQQMDANIRDSQLRALQSMANRQALAQQNQIDQLEAQTRTDRAFSDLQAQSVAPRLPPPPESGAVPMIDAGQLASIPDSVLADSNRRVKAAAANRH